MLIRDSFRFGKAATVDDGCMVQFIRQDRVIGIGDCWYRPGIGGEAGLKDHHRFDPFELRQRILEIIV